MQKNPSFFSPLTAPGTPPSLARYPARSSGGASFPPLSLSRRRRPDPALLRRSLPSADPARGHTTPDPRGWWERTAGRPGGGGGEAKRPRLRGGGGGGTARSGAKAQRAAARLPRRTVHKKAHRAEMRQPGMAAARLAVTSSEAAASSAHGLSASSSTAATLSTPPSITSLTCPLSPPSARCNGTR